MKILSIRKGFHSDHSSTSYEFFAVDKQLSKAEREKVSALSSRARPSRQRVGFSYNGEWSDLPGGWRPLMEKYYDVMYTESYDWWTLAIAFKAEKDAIKKISEYECEAGDGLGLFISSKKDRVIIEISCRMSDVPYFGDKRHYEEYDEDEEDAFIAESDDTLLNILADNRKLLMKGKYYLLYGVWKEVMCSNETEESKEFSNPPAYNMKKIPKAVDELLSLITFEA